ncbi:MAG: ABC transporter permease [Spirochaetales bacterium]|nr:ABC transporter permease [Spirochaetales bacterium]
MKIRIRRKRQKIQIFFLFTSFLYIFFLLAAALASPYLTSYSPTTQDLSHRLIPPFTGGRILGTDDLGRDLWSRIVYGTRPLILIGAFSVGIALAGGLILGILAGAVGGVIDSFIMLLMDGILAFPTVLLAITVVAVMGYGLAQVTLALGIVFIPVFARLVRAETKSRLTEGYVESSRALGTPFPKILLRHVLPNMMPDLIVQSSVTFSLVIVIEASLSFLGLGTQPPEPSWGLLLKESRNFLFQAPWMAIFPGLALAATVFSFNYIGDFFAEKLNPPL